MKQLPFFIICIVFIATSCKKEEKTPTPSTPVPVATSMTATETVLVGIWNWVKSEDWNASGITMTHTQTTIPSLAGAYMDLKTTIYGGITTPAPYFYDCIIYPNGTTGSGTTWQVIPVGAFPTERLAIGASPSFPFNGGFIETLNSTTLIVTSWSGSVPNGTKTYYSR